MYYVLYETSTGKLKSGSKVPFSNPRPDIWSIKSVETNEGIWNEQTLDFDPIPASKKITTLAFMEKFTDAELVGILDAAKVNTQVQLFVMKMEQAAFIDLEYQPTIEGVNALELAGLIGAGRAAEILNA